MKKMKIEIPRQGRMDLSGSGLHRLIQNNHMPLLDLFVRESIQNSLDAALAGKEYVQVEIGTGKFRQDLFAEYLEGISEELIRRYGKSEKKYLFVRDSNTKGLRGPLHFSEDDSSRERDLLKLVYDISKPQEESGSGGSWGLGKTIYFRMGIGLVVYYSRIRLTGGKYQSRLAACLVENENSQAAILSSAIKSSKRGLAWWGEEFNYCQNGINEYGTIPITDECMIKEILDVFHVNPFKGTETGTLILIPYIDEESLLKNNITRAVNGEWEPFWLSNLEDYINVATSRWYFGRLNNEKYFSVTGKPWLNFSCNGKRLRNKDMLAPFRMMRNLYTAALTGENNDQECHLESINLRGLFKSTSSGRIAYKVFSRDELEMNVPDNTPSPYTCFTNNWREEDTSTSSMVFLGYSRKPGMNISYETTGEWVKNIKWKAKSDEYLLIDYVLNSDNEFSVNSEFDTIEDYFRASEKADHASWHDIQIGSDYQKILSKIQIGIQKKVNGTYAASEEAEIHDSSSLSRLFGEMLLPPEGFGQKATVEKKSTRTDTNVIMSNKHVKLSIDMDNVRYLDRQIIIPINLRSLLPTKVFSLQLEVAADGRNVPLESWNEKTGIQEPFGIEQFRINTLVCNTDADTETHIITCSNPKKSVKSVKLELLVNENDEGYGIRAEMDDFSSFDFSGYLTVNIHDANAEIDYLIKDCE